MSRARLTAGIVLMLAAQSGSLALAQEAGTVRGSIRDAFSRAPLAGVQISIADSRFQAVTDAEGRYQVRGVPPGSVVLHVRVHGYSSASATETIPANGSVTVDFALTPSAGAPDERLRTGAERSASEVLVSGRSGVRVLPSSGLAGGGGRIWIRGNASIVLSDAPTVYLDGVRVDNGGGLTAAGSVGQGTGGTPSRLDDINPERIERIDIVRNTAATALYGMDVLGGAIHIITKRPTRDGPQVTLRVDRGFSRFPSDRIKPQAGFARTPGRADTLQGIMRDFATTEDGGPIVPWRVFTVPSVTRYYGTGTVSSYSARVAGGGAGVRYQLAGRYASELGPFHPTEELGPGARSYDRRVQGSASLSLSPGPRVSIQPSVIFIDTRYLTPERPDGTIGIQTALLSSKPETANCAASLALGLGGPFGEDPERRGRCAGPGNEWGLNAPLFGAPPATAQEEVGQDGRHVNAALRATYEAVPQRLRFSGILGVDITDMGDFRRVADSLALPAAPDTVLGNVNNRWITADLEMAWSPRINSTLTSQWIVGFQATPFRRRERFVTGGAGTISADSEVARSAGDLGILSQAQFGVHGWAFLTVGARWDRGTALGGVHVTGALYPKVSASVVLSELPWWNRSMLSTVRLRGALGRSSSFQGANAFISSFLLAPSIPPQSGTVGPEVHREVETGAELGFLGDRLGLQATYWDRHTTDVLVPIPGPPSAGFPSLQLRNAGTLDAHGWDLGLTATVLNLRGLRIDVFGDAAYLHQVVTSLGGAPPMKLGGTSPQSRQFMVEGYAPGSLFGAQILQPCGRTRYARCLQGGGFGTTNADYYPYDTNGDGQPDTKADLLAYLAGPRPLDSFTSPFLGPLLDDNDNDGDFLDHYLGKPTPDWQGAFGAEVRVGGSVTLSGLFELAAGHFKVSNLTDGFRNAHPTLGRNTVAAATLQRDLEDPASTPERRLQALVGWAYRYQDATPYNGLHLVEDGDFVRLRDLGLSYTAPAWFARKLGLTSLILAAAGHNVSLWTGYSGIDPEMNTILDAQDAWGFPLPRRFTLSLRLGW